MGWFSAKKKIYVSSTVYNLAGDIEKRVQYLPSTIASKIVSNSNTSIGEVIQDALIKGPGLRLRRFAKWARESGYTEAIGQTAGKLSTGNDIDINALTEQLQIPVGSGVVTVQSASISEADYGSWADRWMLENHPERVAEDYELDFDEVNNWIYIKWPDGTYYQFQPEDFDVSARYLYASYTVTSSNLEKPVVPGTRVIVGSTSEYPPTAGWGWVGDSSPTHTFNLVTETQTVVTYSDGSPGSSSSSSVTNPQTSTDYWSTVKKDTVRGNNADGTELIVDRELLTTGLEAYVVTATYTSSWSETSPEGVVMTTTQTVYDDQIKIRYYYQIDTQEVILRKWSHMQVLIYKQDTGNEVYDAMFRAKGNLGDFFPFIPLRLDTRFIDENYYPDILERNTVALKKAVNYKYDDLIKSIESNSSMGDIDYAYAVFGVSLNTKENCSRKYLFKFFEKIIEDAAESSSEFPNWKFNWNQADISQKAWLDWKEAQDVPSSPLYGLPEPTRLPYPEMPVKEMRVGSTSMNYDMRLAWTSMSQSGGAGLAKPDAKVGDVWFVQGPTVDYDQLLVSAGLTDSLTNSVDFFTMYWQETAYNYKTIGVWGLYHGNFIYKGKAVITSSLAALDDTEESGFIVPLHEGVFRSMSLKDATQMSTACCYIVFNCYTVVKQKWYATSWFKIVLIIVIIVITVITGGAGGASAGLLGTSAEVGAAVGLAGAAAVIVGSIINAVAAMVVAQIIMSASTKIFGDKVGAIVGAIAAVIGVSVGTSVANGQGIAAGFSSLSSAENLLRLTVAAGEGLAGFMTAAGQDIVAATQKLLEGYNTESGEISKLYEQNLGYGVNVYDPMSLVDVSMPTANIFVAESSNIFLQRTLLTGSDIADLTNGMLTNFVAMTTSTTLPE